MCSFGLFSVLGASSLLLFCNAITFSSEADLHMTKWKVESKLQTQFWTFCTFLSKQLEMLLCVTDTRDACKNRSISVIFHLHFLLSPFHSLTILYILHLSALRNNIKWPHTKHFIAIFLIQRAMFKVHVLNVQCRLCNLLMLCEHGGMCIRNCSRSPLQEVPN